jgi:hypothetical protein
LTAPPRIVPIFAAPFAVVEAAGSAGLHEQLAALFSSRATPDYRDARTPADPLCFVSREDLFDWEVEAVGHLRRQMLAGVCTVVMPTTTYTQAEFAALKMQARARFVIVRPNGCLPAATAPMASWYALYCVAAPAPVPERVDSAALRLYGVRHGTMFKDASNARLRTPYGDSHYLWRPVAGQMAVFPGSILHEVALNRAKSDLVLVTARVRFAHGAEGTTPAW